MSACLLIKQEIDMLVYWISMTNISNADVDNIGKILWSENYKSIRARYGDYDWHGRYVKRPPYHYSTPKAVPTITGVFDPYNKNQALKMVRFYDYQTCETYAYEGTQAWKWMRKLEDYLVRLGADLSKEALWGT